MADMDHGAGRSLVSAIAGMVRASRGEDETTAKVTQVDKDGKVWAVFRGANEATKCEASTVAVKPGDDVSVSLKGGKPTVIGNYTSPATDDAIALAALGKANDANLAAKGATKVAEHVGAVVNSALYLDENGTWVVNSASEYKLISSPGGTDAFPTPGVYVVDGNGNPVSMLGKSVMLKAWGMRFTMDGNGLRVYHEDDLGFAIYHDDDDMSTLNVVRLDLHGPAYFWGNVYNYDEATVTATDGSKVVARKSFNVVSVFLESVSGVQQGASIVDEVVATLPYGLRPQSDVVTASGLRIRSNGEIHINPSKHASVTETVTFVAQMPKSGLA